MGTISCVLPDPVNRVNISDSTYRNYSDVPHSVKLFLLWELNWLSKCKYVGTEFRSSWERRKEIMMLLLSNCRLSIVRLTAPLPDRLRKHNVDMKLVINALISTPSLCDSQCENNLARGSKHYIPPSLPPCLTSPDGVGWNLRAGNRDWAQAEGVGEGQVVSLALNSKGSVTGSVLCMYYLLHIYYVTS